MFFKCFTDSTAVNHHEKPPFGSHSTKNEVFKREIVRRQLLSSFTTHLKYKGHLVLLDLFLFG